MNQLRSANRPRITARRSSSRIQCSNSSWDSGIGSPYASRRREQPRPSLGDLNTVPALYTLRMRPQDGVVMVRHNPKPDAIDPKDGHREADSLFDPILSMLVVIADDRTRSAQETPANSTSVRMNGLGLSWIQDFLPSNGHHHFLRFETSG